MLSPVVKNIPENPKSRYLFYTVSQVLCSVRALSIHLAFKKSKLQQTKKENKRTRVQNLLPDVLQVTVLSGPPVIPGAGTCRDPRGPAGTPEPWRAGTASAVILAKVP